MRSLTPSPFQFSARALVLLTALAVAGCGDGRSGFRSPTAPDAPTATPPPQSATDVTGAWSGIATTTWDEIDGGGSCAEPVTAEFVQRGSSIVGTLIDATVCGPSLRIQFEGTIAGEVLTGSLIHSEGYEWATWGRVSGDQMSFSAWNVVWELRR